MFTLVMALGYIFAKLEIHEKMYYYFDKIHIAPYIIIMIVIISRVLVSTKPTDTQIDWTLTPFFIIAISYVIKGLPQYIKNALMSLGKYSMFIWLTHTFFLYYYFQSFIMLPRELSLIYLLLMIVCIAISVVMEFVSEKVIHLIGI